MVADSLVDGGIEVFKPHEHNPWNQIHIEFPREVFEVDLRAIKESHIGLCLPEFGNDCSWECGWYSNSNKPLVVFVNKQDKWLRDWMVKGGIDYVITDCEETYFKLRNDKILNDKEIILINSINELSHVVEDIFNKNYVLKDSHLSLSV